MDISTPKRAPRWDADPQQQWYYSPFHRTKCMCATCHDVSNPVRRRLLSGDPALPAKQAACSVARVERTFNEFMLSPYAQRRGAAVHASILTGAGCLGGTAAPRPSADWKCAAKEANMAP